MANYINLETLQLTTESEIRAQYPNTSFATPFNPEGYAIVFDAPQPAYDKYSEFVQLIAPVKTDKGHWEQQWAILPLFGEALANAQAQQVIDEKAKIKAEIAKLEDSVTPRRQREAILGTDNGWLANVDLEIAELRGQL